MKIKDILKQVLLFIKALFWLLLTWLLVIVSRLLMMVIMVFGAAILGVFMLIYGTTQTAKVIDMIADLFRKYRL